MRLNALHAVSLALIALLAACATRSTEPVPASQLTDPPFTIVRNQVDQKLAPGVDTVVIDNPYGEIQVRKTQSQAIGASIVEQRIGVKPRSARLDWFVEGHRQGLRVRYDEHDPETPANPRLGRVDLGIFVPNEIGLELRTDFGSIIVRRAGTNVLARSRSGKIVVSASGRLALESESGEIRGFPMSDRWDGTAHFETGGSAVVSVPSKEDIDLSVRASDDLFPSFELDHSERNAEGVWTGSMRRGTGSTRMVVSATDVVLMGESSD